MAAPERLHYEIVAATSEDRDFPASELSSQGTQSKGWQSARHCMFPQEVVLRLEQYSRVQQIQILCHEYKIATRLELYVGTLTQGSSDPNLASWRRLGSMSFDSNERSNHDARELKSVRVDVKVHLLRVALQRPHANSLNLFNQVAIVALSVMGEPIVDNSQAPSIPIYPPLPNALALLPEATHLGPRLAPNGDVDAITAERILELNRKKGAAVAAEDYDEAKALKQAVDRLKAVGAKVAQLEIRKWKAIEEEDYDMAKTLKAEIVRARAGGGSSGASDIAITVDATGHAGQPIDSLTETSGRQSCSTPVARGSRQASADISSTPAHIYDERPAKVSGADAMSSGAPVEEEQPAPLSTHHTISEAGSPPEDWPGGLPPPETLSPADAKDADDFSDLLGGYVAAAFYSKNWQLREAALLHMEKVLQGELPDQQKHQDVFPIFTRAVVRTVKERVPNVFQAGLQVLKQLMESGGKSASREAASATADLLATLMEKAGDSNARIQTAASDAILHLASLKYSGLAANSAVFVKPLRQQTAWRPALARLQLLEKLMPLLGIAATPGEAGLGLEPLMRFVGAAFLSANADVRSAAVNVTLLAHASAGAAVQKLLPRDMNPKIKEQLDAAFKGPGSPPVPAAAAAQKRRSSEGAGRKPASQSSSQAARPSADMQSPIPTAHALDDLQASPLAEDPTPYQLELASREQLLGPSHPEVAVSLSNLAILHNQRGEYDSAQPLYERALVIFELNYGPDDPNVAHTLTDLAVLHLEQGNVVAGRPLLERALAIQEKALGRSHPDVIAIRDVLESDE